MCSKFRNGLISALSLIALHAYAEQREHDAHVHGIGALNVAIDGELVALEFVSPAVNIVGFEHAPSNEQQQQTVDAAMEMLHEGDKMFMFPDEAGCRLETADVHTSMETDHDDEEHEEEHGHEEEHEEEHGHENESSHDQEHGDDEEHEEEHSEFHVEYTFQCEQSGALTNMDVKLFEHFPSIEELTTQIISSTSQQGASLTKDNNVVKF